MTGGRCGRYSLIVPINAISSDSEDITTMRRFSAASSYRNASRLPESPTSSIAPADVVNCSVSDPTLLTIFITTGGRLTGCSSPTRSTSEMPSADRTKPSLSMAAPIWRAGSIPAGAAAKLGTATSNSSLKTNSSSAGRSRDRPTFVFASRLRNTVMPTSTMPGDTPRRSTATSPIVSNDESVQ